MTPKIIFTDLDGTLLRNDKTISLANLSALERAAAQGTHVVVATGRFFGGVPQFLRDLPFLRYFSLMNGAKVYDRQEDRGLFRAEIDLAVAEQVFDLLEPLDLTMDCYQNDRAWMDRRYYDRLDYYIHDPVALKLVRDNRTPVDDFRSTVRAGGTSVQKIQTFLADTSFRPRLMELLNEKFPQLVLSVSLSSNLEINDQRATKGAALLALCRALSIDPAETVAFGDGTNDLTMIQAAGVGVAMANAAPEVLAVADRIAPTNQEDGVAKVLEQWFPG